MRGLARLLSRRRTEATGALALATAGALYVIEVSHVWRRGSARDAAASGDYLAVGRTVTRETVAVVREGYHAAPARKNAMFNMLLAFAATFGAARAVTHMIRAGTGPFRNLAIGRWRSHHFVPGMLIALVAGGVSIGVRREQLDKGLAVPFGGARRSCWTRPPCCSSSRTSTGPRRAS